MICTLLVEYIVLIALGTVRKLVVYRISWPRCATARKKEGRDELLKITLIVPILK